MGVRFVGEALRDREPPYGGRGNSSRTYLAPRSRPEIAIERDSRVAFARLIRELDLDTNSPAESSRPPALRSNRR